MDFATRYPEAIPLRKIDAATVAQALCQIFTRLGLPQEIFSDQGSNFMSHLMKQVPKYLRFELKTTISSTYIRSSNLAHGPNTTSISRRKVVGPPFNLNGIAHWTHECSHLGVQIPGNNLWLSRGSYSNFSTLGIGYLSSCVTRFRR